MQFPNSEARSTIAPQSSPPKSFMPRKASDFSVFQDDDGVAVRLAGVLQTIQFNQRVGESFQDQGTYDGGPP